MGRVPGAHGRPPARAVAAWLLAFGVKGALPAWAHGLRRLPGGAPAGPAWLAPRLRRLALATAPPGAWKRRAGPRWLAQMLDATVDGSGPALTYDHIRHRSAMAGLRARHPIAGVEVVETVLGLPPELAFDPAHGRPLLRAAICGLVPDAVRLRPGKSGFDAPFHAALAGPDLPVLRRLLGARDARTGAHVDRRRVAAELLDGPPSDPQARQWWALHLWRLGTAELWLRMQEDVQVLTLMRQDLDPSGRPEGISVRLPLDTGRIDQKTALHRGNTSGARDVCSN
jgi:hypothetical protein